MPSPLSTPIISWSLPKHILKSFYPLQKQSKIGKKKLCLQSTQSHYPSLISPKPQIRLSYPRATHYHPPLQPRPLTNAPIAVSHLEHDPEAILIAFVLSPGSIAPPPVLHTHHDATTLSVSSPSRYLQLVTHHCPPLLHAKPSCSLPNLTYSPSNPVTHNLCSMVVLPTPHPCMEVRVPW